MEHCSDSSHAAIASSSLISPKIQEGRYWPEKEKCSVSVAINFLFCDGISQDPDLEHLFSWKRNSNSYSVGKSGCFSPFRESKRNTFIFGRKSVSFSDVFGDKTMQQNNDTTKSVSFENGDFDDELFLPPDVGKAMLQTDEETHLREFMYQPNASCTPCSLWKVRSLRGLQNHSPLEEVDYNQSKLRRLRKHSESLDTFSGSFRQKLYFGHGSSTPVGEESVTCNFSQIEESVSKLNIQDPNESATSLEIAPLYPMLLYSAKKGNYPETCSYHIGKTDRKNIQRLRAEEKMKANAIGDFTAYLNSSSDSAKMTTEVLSGCVSSFGLGETTIRYSSTTTGLESLQQKDSLMEQWTVQPQELTLGVGNKGGRVLLINNSKKDLKFKTRYDSKKTNVNPISGNLPAKGKIGLRILVSRLLKLRLKEDTEDTILITCGKNEKMVCVKIRNEQKSTSQKGRSYICF